jgi:hypothetical protein
MMEEPIWRGEAGKSTKEPHEGARGQTASGYARSTWATTDHQVVSCWRSFLRVCAVRVRAVSWRWYDVHPSPLRSSGTWTSHPPVLADPGPPGPNPEWRKFAPVSPRRLPPHFSS